MLFEQRVDALSGGHGPSRQTAPVAPHGARQLTAPKQDQDQIQVSSSFALPCTSSQTEEAAAQNSLRLQSEAAPPPPLSRSLSSSSSRSLPRDGSVDDEGTHLHHREAGTREEGDCGSAPSSRLEAGPHEAAAAAGRPAHQGKPIPGQQPQLQPQTQRQGQGQRWGEGEDAAQLDDLHQDQLEPILRDNPDRYSMFPIQ